MDAQRGTLEAHAAAQLLRELFRARPGRASAGRAGPGRRGAGVARGGAGAGRRRARYSLPGWPPGLAGGIASSAVSLPSLSAKVTVARPPVGFDGASPRRYSG